MRKYHQLSKKEKMLYITVCILYPFMLLFGLLGKSVKLFGTRRRQIVASVLSFAVILTMLPLSSLNAFATIAGAEIDGEGYYTLQDAVDDVAEGQTIKLLCGIEEDITINSDDYSFIIDLNGKTLTGESGITITHKGSNALTIKDSVGGGKINNCSGFATIMITNSGTVNIASGTVSSICTVAIGNSSAGTINISGGTVSTDGGNAIYNNYTGTVNISGGTVGGIGGYAVSNYNGIVNISGGTVNSNQGVAISNNFGTVNISGSTVSSTSSASTILNYCTINISDCTITNENGKAVTNTATVNILGGTVVIKGNIAIDRKPNLSLYVTAPIITASTNINGDSPCEYKAEDILNYKYLKIEPPAVALTGGSTGVKNGYTDFNSAWEAALALQTSKSSPAVITLYKDVLNATPVTNSGDYITLNTNGKSLTFEDISSYDKITNASGELSITGSGTVIAPYSNYAKNLLEISGGTVNLTDATLKDLGYLFCVKVESGAVFNMMSGTIENTGCNALASEGTANIYSGVIKGNDRYVVSSYGNYNHIIYCPPANQTVLIQNNGDISNEGNCGGLIGDSIINGQGTVRVEAQSGYIAYNGVRNLPAFNLKFIRGTLIIDISKGNTTAGYGAFNIMPTFDEGTIYNVLAGANEAGAVLVSSPTADTYTKNNYVKIQSTSYRYKVTLNTNEGSYASGYSAPTTYDEGTGVTLPTGSQISKTGYKFLGWTATNNAADTTYITDIPADATGAKTYYAKWQTEKYKLTIHYQYANGLAAVADYSADLDYNESYNVSSPTITGYTADKTAVTGDMGTSPVTVTVTYKANNYAVQYNLNGGSCNSGYTAPTQYTYGTALTLPTGEQISKTSYTFLGWTATNDAADTAYITSIPADATGAKTYYAKWADKTAPTGDIKIGTNSIKKILNTLTFGWFFKNTVDVTITAQDTSGEAVTIVYYLSETELSDVGSVTNWSVYQNKISLTSKHKYIVYAKLTDPSGNVSVINSDGVVVFTDSTRVTESVTFTKTSTNDVTATVNLNGNTIKEISIGEEKLVKNTDYTVSGDTITLKASCLNKLAAGDYSITILYYPLGETGTPKEGSDTPSSTLISLKVSKATPVLLVAASPAGSQTRPGSVTLTATLPAGATGTLQFKENGKNIGSPVAVGQTVSFKAYGSVNSYTFTVEYSGDSNYSTATSAGLSYSFVKGEQSALSFATGTPTTKTYGDQAFTVTATGGSGTGAVTYSLVSGPATVNGNSVTLTGAGTVKIKATKAADDDYNEKSVDLTITVSPKPVTITGVTAQSKVYDGSKTATVSGTASISGKLSGDTVTIVPGTASFSDKTVKNGKTVSFSGFALTGADAGKYTLSTQPASVTANITAKYITMNVSIQSKAYDGLNTATIASVSLNDVITGDTVTLTAPYPAAAFTSVSVANDIAVSFGGNFTMTGTDAGNYQLTQPTTVKGSITNSYQAAKDTDYTATTNSWSNTEFAVTAKPGFELSLTNTASGTWSNTLTKGDETSNGSIIFYVRNKSTGAISLAATEGYKIDKTAPLGDIKIGESSIKKALNAITFGLFFKDTKTVTITSDDIASGVDTVYYKLSSKILTEAEVSSISDWTEYKGTLTIEPDSKTVVYVKVTDKVGNIVYLGSDGLVLDGSTPAISGIENGKVYCDTVTVTVTDANLDTVTVDGVNTTLTDGKFTLSATGSAQTVIATDKAGNSTSVTVTVYDGHAWDEGVITIASTASKKGVKTYTCTHCGETKTEEIDKLMPEITEGKNGQWKQGTGGDLSFRSNADIDDFISVSVDGKVIDRSQYDIKEGSTIVTLKVSYLATLPVGKHTLGIHSTTGTASAEFSIEAKLPDKKPDETKSPDTGDKSNMLPWFALLFVLGSTFTVFGVKNRKKAVK